MSYDDWLMSKPMEKEEETQDFMIEYGDDESLFQMTFNGTETEARIEIKHLANEYGYAKLMDDNGNIIEVL